MAPPFGSTRLPPTWRALQGHSGDWLAFSPAVESIVAQNGGLKDSSQGPTLRIPSTGVILVIMTSEWWRCVPWVSRPRGTKGHLPLDC